MCDLLSGWTTFGIGGRARRIEIARTRDELIGLSAEAIVLGRGSNILASDDGYDGIVAINRYERIERDGNTVTAGSGVRLGALCAFLAENGLSGLEWACGIPGSVGGAVRMNAGAFGGEISDRLSYAYVVRDGAEKRFACDELGFGYRNSALDDGDVVTDVTFELDSATPSAVRALGAEYADKRRATQPTGKSAGSVFKNPRGVSVGRIFDEAGLKGLRRGGAEISPKHANIIVNTGGATARDVCKLIAVMKDVLREKNVAAHEEIIYLGDFGG